MVKESIIVTGAGTGLGFTTSMALSKQGYLVIAGIMNSKESEQFKGTNIHPIILDITKSDDIAQLTRQLSTDFSNYPLRALINNAGIEFNAPFETLPLDEWRKQFDVNYFGQIQLTQALIPFLRISKGSIVNITSVGGRVAMPNYAPYAGSKFAFEGSSDALRRELTPQGIKVIIVEPGGIKTPMAAYSGDLSLDYEKNLSPKYKKLYGTMIKKAVASQTSFLKHAISATKAGNKVAKIALKKHPKSRY